MIIKRILFIGALAALLSGGLHAQNQGGSETEAVGAEALMRLLERAEASYGEITAANRQRLEEFRQQQTRQQALLEEARETLAFEEQRSVDLKNRFDNNEIRLQELETQLAAELGDMGEVFGTVRQFAGDTRASIHSSLVSSQIEGREEFLLNLGESKELPTINELRGLWLAMQREMTEAGRIVSYPAEVRLPNGEITSREVTRVGTFNAFADGQYLTFSPDTGELTILPRQPADRFQSWAQELENLESGYTGVAVDPSSGQILGALVDTPTLTERIEQGKLVGIVIICIGALGLLISLERFVYLNFIGLRMRGQLRNPGEPKGSNPLGRVMLAFKKYNTPEHDLETLELKLDEAILKETPAFERGLPTIKILAAVAPLLGLLGTVTGMIATFQSITLFGTGDPKLMAGGISEALVTTALGLVVSIPLVLLHSVLSGRSEQHVQLLDEQSAGLIADFAEKKEEGKAHV